MPGVKRANDGDEGRENNRPTRSTDQTEAPVSTK